MTRRAVLALLFVVALVPPASAQHETRLDDARAFVDMLVKQDFTSAVATFDATMTTALPEAKLRDVWAALAMQAGAFKAIEAIREEPRGPYAAVIMTSVFERAKLDLTVVYNAEGQVSGFNMRPASPPPSPPPPYADATAFSERDITVGSGEWALPGTLSLPNGTGSTSSSPTSPRGFTGWSSQEPE